jgi:type II secretory pathway pseudopilin PulG
MKIKANPFKLCHNPSGFSLVEVMVAFTLLANFLIVYVASKQGMLSDSANIKNELEVHQFCEEKINEIKLSPPPLNDQLTLTPETGVFKGEPDSGRDQFEYSIEYKRFTLPDIFQLANAGEEEDISDSLSNQPNAMMGQVFKQIQENIKNLIWQVSVTVKNKETDHICVLSAWINNPEAEIKIGR